MSTLFAQNTPRLNYVMCTSPAGIHRMAYWEWGDPNNSRVLLCVHGLTRTGRDFDALAQVLSAHYRVVCPDIVGRGKSDRLADPDAYVVPQYVADIFTLLARLQPSTLDWIGTSMGGLIGLGVASALCNAQQLLAWSTNESSLSVSELIPFRRMVINDIGPVINTEGLARIGNYIDQELVFDSFEETVANAKVRWQDFGPHTQAQWEHLTNYVFTQQDGQWLLAYDLGIAAPFKKQFLQQKEEQAEAIVQDAEEVLWQAFENLPAEVLIIHGELSDLLSNTTTKEMLGRNPKASLYEVQGVGHAPTLMQTEQIEKVKQFLLQE